MKYDVWLFYPMPPRDIRDEALQKIDGWYGCGSDIKERDHSFTATNLAGVANIVNYLPKDGRITISKY